MALAVVAIETLIVIVGALAIVLALLFCAAWLGRWIFRALKWWQAFIEFLVVVGSRNDPELKAEWKRRKKAGWRFTIHYEPPAGPSTKEPADG